jgi:5,10-methenyltetrahydromethanopterin hydrogenase
MRFKKKPRMPRSLPRSAAETPGTPKLTLELVSPQQLDVTVELPERGELETFTKVLLWLNEGKLLPRIQQALAESPRGDVVIKALELMDAADDDEPVVCPTRAIMYNKRRNQV